jgi:hypothetical protein
MATIAVSSELDVVSKYEALVKSSLGGESVYARMKETIKQLAVDGDISDNEKAKVIAEVLAGLSSSISSSSMSTALQWASTEKDIALKKYELEQKVDVLKNEVIATANQGKLLEYQGVQTQAETRRLYGATTVDAEGKLISLNDSGKIYEDIQLTKAQVVTQGKEQTAIEAKTKESYATIHKVVADTKVNYGIYSGYTIADTGITGSIIGSSANTLSAAQEVIAKEQAKGYAYNAWANALSGSSAALGSLLASNLTKFDDPQHVSTKFLTRVNTALCRLQNVQDPYAAPVPLENCTPV